MARARSQVKLIAASRAEGQKSIVEQQGRLRASERSSKCRHAEEEKSSPLSLSRVRLIALRTEGRSPWRQLIIRTSGQLNATNRSPSATTRGGVSRWPRLGSAREADGSLAREPASDATASPGDESRFRSIMATAREPRRDDEHVAKNIRRRASNSISRPEGKRSIEPAHVKMSIKSANR